MAKYIDGNTIGFVASGVLAAFRRVRLDGSNEAAYASATDDDWIGWTDEAAAAQGDKVRVRLRSAAGTFKVTASEAISKGAKAYSAASGKCASTGTVENGEVLEAAAADGDVIEVLHFAGITTRASLTEEALSPYGISLFEMKLLTGLQLAATAAAGLFGLSAGTHATASPKLVGEAASGNAKTSECRFCFVLPTEYVSAGDVKLRVKARVTGLLQVSQTIDAVCVESDGAAGVSADLVTTAAQALTASFANYDFVITATALVAGDLLDIKLTSVIDDTGGSANKLVEIGQVSLLCDIKG